MNSTRFSVLMFTVAVAFVSAAHAAEPSLAEVKKSVQAGQAVLVDVREEAEWDNGHIAGAIHLPVGELSDGTDPQSWKAKLPKDKILYTHCVSGKRSASAAEILGKLGYEVRPLKPGYKELLEAGFDKAKD